MDQRIENTYTALQGSMRELLGQSAWDEITVRMLCDRAGVSRTTFYSHFNNKEDLLDSLLDMFEAAMLAANNGRSLEQTQSFTFLPLLVGHVSGNRALFAATNQEVDGYPVAVRFRRLIEKLVATELAEFRANSSSNYSQSFIAGGIYWCLVTWCGSSKDATHLKLLEEIDGYVRIQLQEIYDSG